jgi:competence protein ComEA
MKRLLESLQRHLGATRSEALVVTSVAAIMVVGTIGRSLVRFDATHEHATADRISRLLDSLAADSVRATEMVAPAAAMPERPSPVRTSVRARPLPCNINTASSSELEAVPGIGPAMAARIIEARTRRPFTVVEDLLDVRGIGERTLERMRPYVVVR